MFWTEYLNILFQIVRIHNSKSSIFVIIEKFVHCIYLKIKVNGNQNSCPSKSVGNKIQKVIPQTIFKMARKQSSGKGKGKQSVGAKPGKVKELTAEEMQQGMINM